MEKEITGNDKEMVSIREEVRRHARDVEHWHEDALRRLDRKFWLVTIIVAIIGLFGLILSFQVWTQVQRASREVDEIRYLREELKDVVKEARTWVVKLKDQGNEAEKLTGIIEEQSGQVKQYTESADKLLASIEERGNQAISKADQLLVSIEQQGKQAIKKIEEDRVKTAKFSEYMSKARVEAEKGNFAAALKRYRQALEIDKQSPQAWVGVGSTLGMLGRYEEAQLAHESAIKLDPDYAIAWYNKGVILARRGNHGEALKAYEKAIELDPNDIDALTGKGAALGRLDRQEEALIPLEKAIKLEPNYALAWLNKAAAHSHLRQKPEMLGALKRAIELDPDLRKQAKTDPDKDFEHYRNDPDFQELVGEDQ